jgi:membrane protein
MRFVIGIIRSFFRDDCYNSAANISFCALLALIPIAMLMVSVAGYFLGASQEAFDRIVSVAADILPVGRDIFVANLRSVLDQRASLGIVGIIALVFISTILVSSIERALDSVFRATARRNFFHSRMLGIALIFWVTVLFSLPTVVQVLEGLLLKYGFDFPLSELMSGKAYFFLVAFLSYLMMIVVVPNQKIYARYAVVGGVFFAVGIGVLKYIFRAYMAFSVQRYNVIYGSLAAVVLYVVWIYFLSVLLLLSAEIVAEIQRRRIFHRGGQADDGEPAGLTR